MQLRLGAGGAGSELRVIAPPEPPIEPERVVGIGFDPGRLHWFHAAGRRVA
ncbi:MAG: hypothetical protein ACREOF_11830 [Gemmatimonadales bacterium]